MFPFLIRNVGQCDEKEIKIVFVMPSTASICVPDLNDLFANRIFPLDLRV